MYFVYEVRRIAPLLRLCRVNPARFQSASVIVIDLCGYGILVN